MKAIDEWWPHAACRGKPLKLWFPPPTGEHMWNRARRICSTCPVTSACLDYAANVGATHGMYGGLTPDERATEDERCGTEAGFQAHRVAGTTACEACTTARREGQRARQEARLGRTIKRRTRPAECGTKSGYKRHLKAGELPCDACRRAHAESLRDYRDQLRKEGAS